MVDTSTRGKQQQNGSSVSQVTAVLKTVWVALPELEYATDVK